MKKNVLLFFLFISSSLNAQEKSNKKGSEYTFRTIVNLETTEVQNQNQTSTCWSFSSLSFIESELLRLRKEKGVNLSEMFVVRKAYPLKAQNYLRMHGHTNFGEGGGFPDVMNVIKIYGLLPESVYTGKKDSTTPHNHKALEAELKKILIPQATDASTGIDFEAITASVNAVCDDYLGKVPEQFEYNGKTYTPITYAASLGIRTDDYVYLTSFNHHPYYSKFVLEVPDNWNWEAMYNLPLDELKEVMNFAINNGYTFVWAADVSEKGFLYKDGLAIVPEKKINDMTDEEKKDLSIHPQQQLTITQELRQKAFNNYETLDDHGMHCVGQVVDQLNTMYYVIKNSWGKERNQCAGYFYASESYVLYKTTSIMLHKNAIPPAIAKKLGINP